MTHSSEMSVIPCWIFSLTLLACLVDGARKPWERANSADRSMVSRWEVDTPHFVR